MTFHILFSGKSKKNIISLSSAEVAQRVIKAKENSRRKVFFFFCKEGLI